MADDKITNIAELKKAIDARREYYQAEGHSAINSVLKLISEFEAGLRGRIVELENFQDAKVTYNKAAWQQKELRRILGEGGVPD